MNELEQQLVALGRVLDVPEAVDLAPRVLARLGARRAAPTRRRLVLALAVLALAALAATLAIPDARSALLRFFRIGGERIELVDRLPAVAPSPPTSDLAATLGERVSIADARRRAGFHLLELAEKPDAVFIGDRGTVWFLYGGPDAAHLLVAQTPRLRIDETFLLKKLAATGTTVEPVSVRGTQGYFVSGAPHEVALVDRYGNTYPETLRLAHDALVWEEGRRTIRLEGDLTKDEAVGIADSLR